MRRGDEVRLRHLLDAPHEAVSFARGQARGDLDNDHQPVPALVKGVEIVGEAARQLTDPTRQRLPGIPSKQIVGLRDGLSLAYFDISLEVVWKTVRRDLPALGRANTYAVHRR